MNEAPDILIAAWWLSAFIAGLGCGYFFYWIYRTPNDN